MAELKFQKTQTIILLFALFLLTASAVNVGAATYLIIYSGVKLHTDTATVTAGDTLSLTNLKLKSGYLVLSDVTLTITPSTTVSITLNSFDPSAATTNFTADGTQTTYAWDWNPSTPYLKETSGQITSLAAYAYSSDQLQIAIDATGITTTQVYCGSKGQPVAITPLSADGGYDAGTSIQTIVWAHSSPQEFTLDWTPTGGDGGGGGGGTTLYRLAVKVLRGSVPVPQASVSVGSDTSATDSEGIATFNLRAGVYTVTVNLGNETQTKQVDLRSNTEVTFTLASGWSFPNIPSMDDGTMRTIVFVGIVLTVMLFLIRKKKIK